MRVLLMPHRYPPSGAGGVESWAEELARGATGRGHRVAILTRDDTETSPFPPFAMVEGAETPIPVHRIRHRHSDCRSFADSWGDDRFRCAVGAAIDGFGPDVVHLGHPDGWGVIPLREAAVRGIATVATLHDYKWLCARGQMVRPPGEVCAAVDEERCVRCVGEQLTRGPIRALVAAAAPRWLGDSVATRDDAAGVEGRPDPGRRARDRWRRRQKALLRALQDADGVTSPSHFVARRHRDHGLDRPIDVIPNGLGDVADDPTPAVLSGPLRFGFFGNPHPAKGLDLLLAAFASVPAGAATLDLFGPAPADLPGAPAGVVAHGRYDRDDAVRLMTSVDVVAIPSTWDENHPVVAVEAGIARRPLLVADRGGLMELVTQGRDGWLVLSGDVEAWGERLAMLAAIPGVARAASAKVRRPHSADQMAAAFETVWIRAASDRRPSV